jgi:putative transposase
MPMTVLSGSDASMTGLLSTAVVTARPVFLRPFQEHGLPAVIRTDNGVPVATTARGRLSTLSVWWIRLGILPELIAPASPQQSGRHERRHRTLKAQANAHRAVTSKPSRSGSIGFVTNTTTTARTRR